MVRTLTESASRPVIAFAGGGASATLTAVALLRTTTWLRLPYQILLIDEHGRHARGAAYSTTDPAHLLNSPVKAMSALPDQPGHLARWLHQRDPTAGPDTFLPRRVYGDYLADTLIRTARWAHPHASVRTRTARVESARPEGDSVTLRLSDGTRLSAAALVVATGNTAAPVGSTPGCGAVPGVVSDPWHPTAGLDALAGCERVLAVGSGLTMVDAALTLTRANPSAVVYAVSRGGRLPHPHQPPLTAPPGLVDLGQEETLPLRTLVRRLRTAVAAYPGDWRHVIDSLRPHAQALWQGLSPAEQRRFLERWSRHWENARHRMAPRTAERIALLRAEHRLRLHSGGVRAVAPAGAALRAALGDGSVVDVDAVLDCTGAAPGRAPLITRMFADGLARPDPVGLGVYTCPRGALVSSRGAVSHRMFTLGPPRRGQLYETTAIPEIRAQAEQLAQRIADTVLRDRRDPPTVA